MCAAGTKTARRNLKAGFKALKRAGVDPSKSHCCIDIGAGKKFAVVTTDKVGTLTASRCAARGLWLTKACSSVQFVTDDDVTVSH